MSQVKQKAFKKRLGINISTFPFHTSSGEFLYLQAHRPQQMFLSQVYSPKTIPFNQLLNKIQQFKEYLYNEM